MQLGVLSSNPSCREFLLGVRAVARTMHGMDESIAVAGPLIRYIVWLQFSDLICQFCRVPPASGLYIGCCNVEAIYYILIIRKLFSSAMCYRSWSTSLIRSSVILITYTYLDSCWINSPKSKDLMLNFDLNFHPNSSLAS